MGRNTDEKVDLGGSDFLVAGVVGGYSVAHYHENELQYQRNITNGQTAIAQKIMRLPRIIFHGPSQRRKTTGRQPTSSTKLGNLPAQNLNLKVMNLPARG
ncbi:hypothetical protein V6R94_09695 [Pediococcus acidilactici]